MKTIYLDYASNTPSDERVLETFLDAERHFEGNANSNHVLGHLAKDKISEYQNHIANLLNVKKDEIIFTSGASESNNLAIKGIAESYHHLGKHMLSTSIDHPSLTASLNYLQRKGYEIELINITKDGLIDLVDLKEKLREDTILIAISLVDSELGSVQPIKEIRGIMDSFPNCHLLVDATQAIGKIDIDFSYADLYSFSAHKFYGINGIGILIKKENIVIEPLVHGGHSTTIYRSGTPTLSLIASMDMALNIALIEKEKNYQKVKEISEYATSLIKEINGVTFNKAKTSLPHFIDISIDGKKAIDTQEYLSSLGICVSTKTACSVPNTPSKPVLYVTGSKKLALSSIRVSISHLSTKEEIDYFIKALKQWTKK